VDDFEKLKLLSELSDSLLSALARMGLVVLLLLFRSSCVLRLEASASEARSFDADLYEL